MSSNLLNNSTNNNNPNETIQSNPLSISSTLHRRIGIRRRWESFKRNNQSVENSTRVNPINSAVRPSEETFNERNTINNTLELNLCVNPNSDNNLTINSNRRQNNLSNNIRTNNAFNNDINNNNSISNSRYNESPSSQYRHLRRLNYIGRQNRHLLLTIYNNNLIQNNSHNIDNHIVNNNNLNNNQIGGTDNTTHLNNNQMGNTNNNQIGNTNDNINSHQINHNSNHMENHININRDSNNSINRSHHIQNSINNSNSITNNRARNHRIINNIMNRSMSSRSGVNINHSINNNINKNLKEIKEEEKKREETETEICKEENLGSEIKDTVKCYICFDKITKPKMCPHCHRIACEKCLYNWFINLKKDKCGFCRLKSNFYEMISVPFMDAVVNFVDQFFNKRSKLSDTIDKEFLEYCPEHKNEMLYYYCLDCGKPYCKTCFVFFGEEKDKHIDHSIIEYEKYKKMSMPLLKKNTDKLETNIQHVEENIKKCLAYKTSYEHERKVVNKFLKKLEKEFNNQIDNSILIIDEQIKKLKDYINEYNKYKKEVEYFYGDIKHKNNTSDKSCESLIIKLTKINQQKFFSSKDIEKLSDLSKNMFVNTYQSKEGEYNHENIFLSRGLKMGNSPYEMVIDNKQRNEVQISLTIQKEKINIKHNFQAFVFIRKKGECVQTYDLDEYREDDTSYYLKKKIPWDFFGQSVFRIKGILYDFYFE